MSTVSTRCGPEATAPADSTVLSDGGGPWGAFPKWADFLVRVGSATTRLSGDRRRVVVVSMPCDSAGAALVALGALRWRLAQQNADDRHSHLERIQQLARQGASNVVLRHDLHRGRFFVDRVDAEGRVWVRQDMGKVTSRKPPLRMAILADRSTSWTFDGEPPAEVLEGAEIPYGDVYDGLTDGTPSAFPLNLRRSDSGVCLAGRIMGGAATQAIASSLRFSRGETAVGLDRLLTVHAWSAGMISRVTLFNTRTDQFDRRGVPALVAAADGDQALLHVLDSDAFQHTHLVGVIHRTVERDRLEAINERLANLAQWYTPDSALRDALPAPPCGISFASLKRR